MPPNFTGSFSVKLLIIFIEDQRDTPAQTKSREKIAELESQLASLITIRNSGLSTVTKKQIDDVKEEIKKEKTRLDR